MALSLVRNVCKPSISKKRRMRRVAPKEVWLYYLIGTTHSRISRVTPHETLRRLRHWRQRRDGPEPGADIGSHDVASPSMFDAPDKLKSKSS